MVTSQVKNVVTVDAAQGQEADIVIFSTVRTQDTQTIGHVADQRRVNVAITRACKRTKGKPMMTKWRPRSDEKEAKGGQREAKGRPRVSQKRRKRGQEKQEDARAD